MSESSLFHLFRSRWQELARRMWPETPREQLESELAHVDAELARRQNRLLVCRKKMEKLHDRLKRRERRLALLAASVQKAPADTGALAELERQREGIDRLRERLQGLENGYARRLAHLRQRKRESAELRERLLSGPLPTPMSEESDPDYPF